MSEGAAETSTYLASCSVCMYMPAAPRPGDCAEHQVIAPPGRRHLVCMQVYMPLRAVLLNSQMYMYSTEG